MRTLIISTVLIVGIWAAVNSFFFVQDPFSQLVFDVFLLVSFLAGFLTSRFCLPGKKRRGSIEDEEEFRGGNISKGSHTIEYVVSFANVVILLSIELFLLQTLSFLYKASAGLVIVAVYFLGSWIARRSVHRKRRISDTLDTC